MPHVTRRQFIATTALVTAALATRRAAALPLGLPLGLQLYSVRELLAKDLLGTLKQLYDLGYREVEAAGFFNMTPDQVKQAMAAAKLSLVSAHFPALELSKSFDAQLAYCKSLGLQYMICSFPGIKDPTRLKDQSYRNLIQSFTMDDYRWNAERFNEWGRKARAVGIKFGYHNHTMEFAAQDGVVPLDEMIRLTDPELVTYEMDCGWVVVGGADPVKYLERYPNRISMLHIKDFKPSTKPATVIDPPEAAELGHGTQDFRGVFEAAKRGGHIRHYFVEQEAYDMPPYDALRIDAEYMQRLKA